MGFVRSGALFASTIALSCSALVAVDGLSGGRPDQTSEAGAGSDAESDVVTVVGDHDIPAAAAFCDLIHATFCEDFDVPDGSYRVVYDSIDQEEGGTVFVDPTRSTSKPHSLRASVPGGPIGPLQLAGLSKQLGDAIEIHHAFDVRFEPGDFGASNEGLEFAQTMVVAPGTGGFAQYRFRGSSTLVYEAHVYPPAAPDFFQSLPVAGGWSALAAGGWHHVEIDLNLTPPTHALIVIDNVTVVDGTFSNGTTGPGSVSLIVGIYHPLLPTIPWTLNTDNVIVDLKAP